MSETTLRLLVYSEKDLGIMIDEKHEFVEHIDSIVKIWKPSGKVKKSEKSPEVLELLGLILKMFCTTQVSTLPSLSLLGLFA